MNKLTILLILILSANVIYSQSKPNPMHDEEVSISNYVETNVKIFKINNDKYAMAPVLDLERDRKGGIVVEKFQSNGIYYAEFNVDINPKRVKKEILDNLTKLKSVDISNILNPGFNSLIIKCNIFPDKNDAILYTFEGPGKFSGSQIPCNIKFDSEQLRDDFIAKLKNGKITISTEYKTDATITIARVEAQIKSVTFSDVISKAGLNSGNKKDNSSSPWYDVLGKRKIQINQNQKKSLEGGYKKAVELKITYYGQDVIDKSIETQIVNSSVVAFNNIFKEKVIECNDFTQFADALANHAKYQYPSKSFDPDQFKDILSKLSQASETKEDDEIDISGDVDVDVMKLFSGKAKFKYKKKELREDMKKMGYEFSAKNANIIVPKSITFYNLDETELSESISIDKSILRQIDGEMTDNLTFVSVPPNQEVSDNLNANLVCHFPFDNGNARNKVEDGRVKDGSFIGENGNTPVTTTGINGEKNGALYFNGISGIQVPNSDHINFLPKQSYSLSLWIRYDSDENDNHVYKGNTASSVILDKWDNPKNFKDSEQYLIGENIYRSSHGYPYTIRVVGATVGFARYTGRGVEYYPKLDRAISSEIKNKDKNKYYHVVATVENGKQALFIDGEKVNEIQDSYTNLTVNNYPFFIGCRGEGIHYGYKGSVDELRIYNKALSLEEVKYLFDNKK